MVFPQLIMIATFLLTVALVATGIFWLLGGHVPMETLRLMAVAETVGLSLSATIYFMEIGA